MVIPREPRQGRGLRRDYTPTPQITKPYLFGVLHDATERRTTFRVASKSRAYCEFLARGIKHLGSSAWVYREGKQRNLWIVEFSRSLLRDVAVNSKQDRIDYVRGYFDTEGGIAKSPKVRYYLYFAQKNKADLLQVKKYLEELKISCGVIHNPSRKADPDYWRFFIRAESYDDFARIIGSYHSEKRDYLRMKR